MATAECRCRGADYRSSDTLTVAVLSWLTPFRISDQRMRKLPSAAAVSPKWSLRVALATSIESGHAGVPDTSTGSRQDAPPSLEAVTKTDCSQCYGRLGATDGPAPNSSSQSVSRPSARMPGM
jgi:hypothetical protein